MESYRAFLEAKASLAAAGGFPVSPEDVHPILKPHQRAMVVWAVRGGRRAIFASFGLGKTLIQLEIVRLTQERAGGRALIILPLGVRQEFLRDATMVGLAPQFIRSIAEADAAESQESLLPDAPRNRIYLTNYETVRDGKLDPRQFSVISLDEAGILRGFGGTKTFREFMRMFEGTATYRFVATATPDPNEYIELLAYAAFLDVMDVGQAKTRWFKRDSTKADKLTIHPHKEREFWLWVSSWALFVQRPSDLGYSDEGYTLPAMDVRWHEVPTNHAAAGEESWGQIRLLRNSAYGVSEAAREKRESLAARTDRMMEIVRESPRDHVLLWHDLEAERHAIKAALPEAVEAFGAQDLEEREQRIGDFSDGKIQYLATKPVLSGSGCNFQRFCHRAIFLGIGFKFNDFIQACHRIHRFLQTQPVRIDLIYTEAERSIRQTLEAKWARHTEQSGIMSQIIHEYGLADAARAASMRRSIGVERREASGEGYRLVQNDCVEEMPSIADASVDFIITSIPFSTQYEYTPTYNDFGHSDDNAQFWQQMDFLTPHLVRVLQPGRVCAIHVKDRITPGGITGLGFQTVQPLHAEAIFHYQKHGFAYLGMKTIVTDVVRENNQTYRLGWTEQCKDGSRMGVGMPEYLLLFRKPPTDSSNGYADLPVQKDKAAYTLARWQLDAHAFARSNGNRPLMAEDLKGIPHHAIYKLFRKYSQEQVYDFEQHVKLAESLGHRLPVTFMLLPPHSWHPDIWSDVARMRTLNVMQEAKGREMHLCPLQFDIVDRLITQFSMEGETVLDPFAGLMTVPYCAVRLKRKAIGIELSATYFQDGARYVDAAARGAGVPMLFDLLAAVTPEDGGGDPVAQARE